MRWVVLLAVIGACRFEHGIEPPADVPPDEPIIVPTWDIDSMSGKGVPTSSQWTELIQAKGLSVSPPDHLWLMQESSGSLVDTMGSPAAPLFVNPSGPAPTYRNTVVGWSRVAVGTSDTQPNQGFGSDVIGNLNGTSHLLLIYVVLFTTPTTEASICGIGNSTDHHYVSVTAPPAVVFKGTGYGMSPTSGGNNPMSVVHPVLLEIDATNNRYTVYTDQEKLMVQWKATNNLGPLVTVGNAIVHGAPARYLYGAMWSGPKAELSDAAVKSTLTALGWTVTGY